MTDGTSRGWNSHDTLGLDCDAEWVKTPRRVRAFPFKPPFKPLPGSNGEARSTSDGAGDGERDAGTIPGASEAGVKQGALGGWHALVREGDGHIFRLLWIGDTKQRCGLRLPRLALR